MKKRYIIKSFCISLFLLFVSSCITDNKNSEKRVLSTTKAHAISDLIDTLRYVSLYNDTVPFSGRIDKIMSKGDTLYIFDAMISKSLRAYSKDGRFLFNVGMQGRGPGEYIEMMNFTIDNKYFYCVDNAKKELLIYDINNDQFYTNNRIEDLLYRKLPTDAKFILPFNSVVDDEIVAIIDRYVRYDELLELGFPAATPAMKEQFNNGETLLVLYKLKL